MPRSEHTPRRDKRRRPYSSTSKGARSVPHKKPFIVAVLLALVFYLSIIALVTTAIAFIFVSPELKKTAAKVLVGCLILLAGSWLASYVKRKGALCPLCRSTPYLDNMAHKHELAYRLKPLNFGTTAILNTALRQGLICMYCGTAYDLRKKSKRL